MSGSVTPTQDRSSVKSSAQFSASPDSSSPTPKSEVQDHALRSGSPPIRRAFSTTNSTSRSTGVNAVNTALTRSLPSSQKHIFLGDSNIEALQAKKRANVVIAARYRSAARTASLFEETGIKDPELVHSRVAISEGEAIAITRMLESDHHLQEVLNRAEKERQIRLERIKASYSEKQKRTEENLHRMDVAKKRSLSRRRELLSRELKKCQAHRQKELQSREEKLKKELLRASTVRCDPFSFLVVRECYRSPPPSTEDELLLEALKHPSKNDASDIEGTTGKGRNATKKRAPRIWR